MKLDWIILAEGFGTAANGAVTAIGINQQVIVAPSLPVTAKRGVLAHFADDTNSLHDQELEVTLSVADPSGKAIVTQTAPARMAPPLPWPDLPAGVDIFLELPLRLSEYGSYEISLAVKLPDDDPVVARVNFYVKGPFASSSDS